MPPGLHPSGFRGLDPILCRPWTSLPRTTESVPRGASGPIDVGRGGARCKTVDRTDYHVPCQFDTGRVSGGRVGGTLDADPTDSRITWTGWMVADVKSGFQVCYVQTPRECTVEQMSCSVLSVFCPSTKSLSFSPYTARLSGPVEIFVRYTQGGTL